MFKVKEMTLLSLQIQKNALDIIYFVLNTPLFISKVLLNWLNYSVFYSFQFIKRTTFHFINLVVSRDTLNKKACNFLGKMKRNKMKIK